MKKVVTLGMVAVMSAALCFNVYADNNSTITAPKAVKIRQGAVTTANINSMKLETKTIKGIVKEVNGFGIKITAEDGKIYVIPTGMIADTAEYKAMKLNIGDSITAEGFNFENMKGVNDISFSIDVDDAALEGAVHITKAVPATEAIVAAEVVPATEIGFVQTFEKADLFELKESEVLFPAEKITANGVTVEMEKLMTKAVRAEAMKIETKTIKGTVKEINEFGIKINGEDNKIYVIPTAMLTELKEFKSMNLKVGDSITVEGPDIEKMMGKMKEHRDVVYFGTPAVASVEAGIRNTPENDSLKDKSIIVTELDKTNIFKLEKGDIMFPAEKISANGVTIDINKLMMELHKPIQIKLSPKN